jgi:hypothetical protein
MPLYPVTMAAALLENALHHTGAGARFPADLEDAVAVGLPFENSRFHSGVTPTPAELGPVRPRALNLRMTLPNPFGVGCVPT